METRRGMKCWGSILALTLENWDGRVVSSARLPHFAHQEVSWYSLLLAAEWIPGLLSAEGRKDYVT